MIPIKIFLLKLSLFCFFSTAHGELESFDPEAPDAVKRAQLLKYFSPQPGEIATIDFSDFRNKGRGWMEQQGSITVTPPKGVCFNIRISKREGDKYVCKKTNVIFRVRDMDLDGSFSWLVSTSERDFGTQVYWKTPYRIGRVVESKYDWPGPSSPVFIKECKEIKTGIGKKIELTVFRTKKDEKDKRWIIRLPVMKVPATVDCDTEYEKLLEKQRKEAMGEEYVEEDEKKDGKFDNLKIAPKSPEEENKCYSRWQTNYKTSFLMSGEGFTAGVGIPTEQGECRYSFSGYMDDPESGSIECLKINNYNWVYLPLNCMTDS